MSSDSKPKRSGRKRRKQLRDAQHRYVERKSIIGLKAILIYLPIDALEKANHWSKKSGLSKEIVHREFYLAGQRSVRAERQDREAHVNELPDEEANPSKPVRKTYEVLQTDDVDQLRKERNKCQRRAAYLTTLLPKRHRFRNSRPGRGPSLSPRAPNLIRKPEENEAAVKAKEKMVLEAVRQQSIAWGKRTIEIEEELVRLKIVVP